MNREEIFQVIRPIIEMATGTPNCILADQNEEAPSGEYCAVEPKQSIGVRGQPRVVRANSVTPMMVDSKIIQNTIAECTVDFYRGDARSTAARVIGVSKLSSVSEALFKAGIAWNKTDGPIDLTALQSDQKEQRAQIKMYLAFEQTDSVTISTNTIEQVELIVRDEKDRILQSENIKSEDAPA